MVYQKIDHIYNSQNTWTNISIKWDKRIHCWQWSVSLTDSLRFLKNPAMLATSLWLRDKGYFESIPPWALVIFVHMCVTSSETRLLTFTKSAREEERGFFSKKYRFFSLRLLGKRKVRFRNLNNLRSQTVPVKKGQTSESPFSVVAFI